MTRTAEIFLQWLLANPNADTETVRFEFDSLEQDEQNRVRDAVDAAQPLHQ